jgi:uncharacterized membrane protein
MTYNLLLFVHVLGVIAWFGAGLLFQTTVERALRAPDRSGLAALTAFGKLIPPAYFMVAPLLVLAAGLGMVVVGNIPFSTPFIHIGMGGLIASTIIGVAVIGKSNGRLAELIETPGTQDPEIYTTARRLRAAGRIDALIMLTVVYAMTVKPFS